MASTSEEKQRNLDRFGELINAGNELIQQMEPLAKNFRYSTPKRIAQVCVSEFTAFSLNSKNLIRIVLLQAREYKRYLQSIDELKPCIESTEKILGYLVGLQSDYEKGNLDRLRDPVVAEISAEILSQAEELLDSDDQLKEEYGPHIAAASVCGAVLEHALRRLCHKQIPPILLEYQSNGKPKKKLLDRLIVDLQKRSVITKSMADRLRSCAKLRNSADHGCFSEAPPREVKFMIDNVKSFLEEYA